MSARDELADLFYSKTDEWALGMADQILARGYRKPLTIENDKLVIDDGLLVLEVGGCTCSPYGSSHEAGCGYEYLDDLTKPLERAGYQKPRTITTAEQLVMVEPGTVLQGPAFHDETYKCTAPGTFHAIVSPTEYRPSELVSRGPFTVLWEPQP